MDRENKLRELHDLYVRTHVLEKELGLESFFGRHFTIYHILVGALLGLFGAFTSLLYNIVGCVLADLPPLKLIQVYLTINLGDYALTTTSSKILAGGCFLYLATGALIGVPFYLVLQHWFGRSLFITRLLAATILGLGIWLINYYAILYWLQPLLFEDAPNSRWIVDQVPWYVASSTHLVFAWTILLARPLGNFIVQPIEEPGKISAPARSTPPAGPVAPGPQVG